MDWSKVKAAIGHIAPFLAGTLGSPIAGIAVQGLCDVFGLSADSATPDKVMAALAGATPSQLQDLKNEENRHAEFMAKLGYDSVEKLEQSAVDDRTSARDLAKADVVAGNVFTGVLAAVVRPLWGIGAFVVVVYYVASGNDIKMPVQSIIETVIAFYFGGRVTENIMPHVAGIFKGK